MKRILLLFFIGVFNITGLVAQVANDDCVNATPITLSAAGTGCATGTTTNAIGTSFTSHPCWPTLTNIPDVWYSFVTTGTDNTITVAPNGGSPGQKFGVTISSGGCAAGGINSCNVAATNNGTATVNFTYPVGTTVWINVGSMVSQGGFQVCVNSVTPPPSPGNSCNTATPICDKNPFTLNPFPNNSNGSQPPCFGSSLQRPIFYTFTVAQGGTLAWTATLTGAAEYDWALYNTTSGCFGTNIACNYNYTGDFFGNNENSVAIGMQAGPGTCSGEFCDPVTVVAGNTYVLIIDNYSDNNIGFNFTWGGTFTIAPLAQFTPSATTTCTPPLNVSFTNTSTGASTQSWNFGNGNTSTAATPPNQTYTTPGTYIVSLTTTSATGCIDVVTSNITVGATPTVTVPTSTTVCAGTSIPAATFTSSPTGATYAWTNTNTAIGLGASGNANIPSFTATNSTGAPISGVISVTPTLNGCVGAPVSYTITVNPNITTTVNSETICPSGTATLTATGGTTYTWTPSTGLSATTGASVTANPTVTTNYTVTGTTGGCSSAATSTVTVTPNPTVTVNSETICTGSTATLTANGAATYTWTPATDLSATTGASVTANPTVTTTYTVTGTTNGCSNTATSTVTIGPAPPISVNSETICVGSNTTLNASGASAYSWAPATGLSATTGASVTANPTVTTTYTVTETSSGCNSTATSTVTVNPLPTATAGSDAPECENGTINFTAGGGTSYSWAGPNAFSSGSQNPTLTSVTTAMSGTYTVTVTDANTCVATATTSVTVNPPPTATAGSDAPECENGTINFTAGGGTSYSWTGPDAFSSTNQNPTLTPVTSAMAGTYTVTVTDANTCVATATTDVVVNPLPPATAGSDAPECENGTINFTSGGGTSYSWAGPNAFSSANQNPTLTSVTTAMSGTYTVTVTDGNNCVATATTDVVVNPLPTVTAGNTSPSCTGGTIDLSSTGGTGYSWAGPNGFSDLTQNPQLTNVTLAMNGTYTVTVTDANSCVNTAVTTVTVNPGPTPIIGSDSPQCVGGTLNLTSGGGSSYAWSGPNGFSDATQNPVITPLTLAMNGTYTVTVTDAATSCVSTMTTNVTVNALPAPSAGNDGPECENGTINLSSGGGAAYSWAGPNAYSSLVQNPSLTGITTAMNGTYTVTVTDGNNCVATATTSIQVNAAPTVNIGSDAPECVNGTINFTSGGGVSYSWAGPNSFSSTNQNPVLSGIITSMAGTYTVTVTDANTCVASATTAVIVHPLPSPTISSNSPVCLNGTINLTAGGGASYSWSGPAGFLSSSATPSISPATAANQGAYGVVVTDFNGCTAPSAVNVTVVSLPTPFAGSNGPICAGDNLLLSLSQPYASYSWTGPNSFTSSVQGPQITGATTSATGTYSVTVTDNNTCAGTTTVSVTVNPLPTGTFANMPSTCAPWCDTFSFVPQTNNIVLYEWDLGIGTVNINNDSIAHCYNNPGSYDIMLTLTDANTCSNILRANDWVTVFENPTADFIYTPNPISIFEPTVTFYDNSVGPQVQSFDWQFGTLGILGSSTLPSPVVTFPDVGVYEITYTIVSTQGCIGTVTRPVSVMEEFAVYIPNSFTPNGDGDNETFGPVGIGIDKEKYHLYIYDRWGEKLFESNEIGKNWDGRKSGSDQILMEDVYIYKFECRKMNGEKFTKSGHVTLVK